MEPTSDERREVAERLRKTRGIMAFVDALGIDFDSDWWCWTDVSRLVADLIDPTCHVTDKRVVVELADGTRKTGGLLSCGHAYFGGDVPKYCAECGARCVDNGGSHAGAD